MNDAKPPLALRLLAVPVVVAVLLVGLWLVAGRVAGGYWTSIALGTAWFVVASIAFGRLTKPRPAFRPFVRGAFAATALAAVVAFYWTSIRETTVDEQLVTGVPASQAAEAPAAADGARRAEGERPEASAPSATALAARTCRSPTAPSRRSATAGAAARRSSACPTGPAADPARVRHRPGADGRGAARGRRRRRRADHVLLGDLKATRGNQQYTIPKGTDLARYRTVVFWCVPFSQSLARAALRPS
jgi:hypothetical protein